jgi:hypothetical protein
MIGQSLMRCLWPVSTMKDGRRWGCFLRRRKDIEIRVVVHIINDICIVLAASLLVRR